MATNIFTLSEKAQQEYSALVVRIENLTPIENSDRLAQTIVGGNSIVVSNQTKIGSVMVYVPIECAINDSFLSANNLFELGQCHRNSNRKVVEQLIEEGKKDEAKKLVGFFNKHGRVKVIRLRGVPSMGFLIEKESLVKWNPKLADVNLEDFVGQDFDTIGGKLFVEPYIPFVRPIPSRINNGTKKRNDKLSRFDRIIPNTFSFHYDTNPLQRNMHLFKPTDVVTITAKIHGCVDRDTIISTKELGDITIGEIVDKKINCHVKAFDVDNEEICYAPIDDFYLLKNDGEWYEIELEDGRKITITGNNPVWLPQFNAYRRVDELVGDELLLID